MAGSGERSREVKGAAMGKGGLIGTIIAEVGRAAERDGLVRPGDSRWDPETNTLHIDGGARPTGDQAGERTRGRERVRRLVDGADPDAPTFPPTGTEWVNRQYLARGGNPLSESAPLDDWRPAPEIERIAELLIAKHRRFKHLRNRQVVYRWNREGGQIGGKDTLGKCVKVSKGIRAFDVAADFLIWIAADHCQFHHLTAYQLEALIFHELCHAAETEKGKPKIAPHDVTAFVAEVQEYGLWMADLQLFGRAVARATGQMTLWDDREGEGEGEDEAEESDADEGGDDAEDDD